MGLRKSPISFCLRQQGLGISVALAAVVLFWASLPAHSFGLSAQTGGAVGTTAASQQTAPSPSQGNSAYQRYLKERRDVERYQRKQERKEEVKESKVENPEAHDDAYQYRHAPMVRSIAHALGLSTEVAARIFESLNFLILLVAVVWFLARLLPRTLRNRKERIQNEIELARAATEDANRRLADVEQRLSRLDEEIHSVQVQAQQETAAEEQRLRAALEEEKHRIVAAAENEVNAASANAQRQLKNLTAELVIEHARRGMAVNAETDRLLVDAFVTELPSRTRGGGVN
ncbi:MAG TPA: ATP synthase F0 subunit B [Acidobacteriaceae bacterium]|nr:ATP synthase F0 subunit B [Acidobacteriaceae bacterium]